MPTKTKTVKIDKEVEERTIDEVETVPEVQNGTPTEIKPTYVDTKVKVIRCDASSLEKNLNAVGYSYVDKILVEPSYNGAFFNIIYRDFCDQD